VVCVVDAEAAVATLDRRSEAREQVLAADRLLLTKLDVAPASAVTATHAALAALNARAERASFPRDDAAAPALTAWLLDGFAAVHRLARSRAPGPLVGLGAKPHVHSHSHSHAHGQLTAVVFVDRAPLVAAQVEAVVLELGDRLVRAKGFVHIAGDARRGFLEKAGARTELRFAEPWGDEPPTTELVLIGDDLDEAAVHRALWACRSAG
jgi:G3E family GTPase